MNEYQQMLEEREYMAEQALRECLEKGVSEDSIKTLAFEMGLSNLTERNCYESNRNDPKQISEKGRC